MKVSLYSLWRGKVRLREVKNTIGMGLDGNPGSLLSKPPMRWGVGIHGSGGGVSLTRADWSHVSQFMILGKGAQVASPRPGQFRPKGKDDSRSFGKPHHIGGHMFTISVCIVRGRGAVLASGQNIYLL